MGIANDTMVVVLLLVGFKYERTKMYRCINEKVRTI